MESLISLYPQPSLGHETLPFPVMTSGKNWEIIKDKHLNIMKTPTDVLLEKRGIEHMDVLPNNEKNSEEKENEWNVENHPDNSDSEAENEPKSTGESQCQKQSQLSATLKWLSENYERSEGVCLPRCVLYTHYLDFCKKKKFSPAGAATFGKVIRQRFPKLTTRRLGTRGQSKYHYYGIGIKESSIYYHSVYSGKGLTRFSGVKIRTEGSSRKYSLSSKSGTLLPEFPESNNLILPENVEREKVYTFIMMYRTHCQRILDTVISANFDEIQNFYLHFWQGMPDHLVDILHASITTDIVGWCDSILYKVLVDVLIPSTIQDLPESLATEIKLFVKRLPYWHESCLEGVPQALKDKKLQVLNSFIHNIKRQISFVNLAQTARTVLMNHDNVNQMIEDLAEIDLDSICAQAAFTDSVFVKQEWNTIQEFFEEFQDLLIKQAPIEGFTEWMDNLIDKCVIQPSTQNGKTFMDKAGEFLRHWSIFGSLLMRDLTLQSASSFGSFHLIHMMFDEYVFLVIETQQAAVKEQELQKTVQKLMKTAGEISMQAKVRNGSKDKNKKKKLDDILLESNDGSMLHDETRSHNFLTGYTPQFGGSVGSGTAFTRPNPTRDGNNYYYPNTMDRYSTAQGLSTLKHYALSGGHGIDRSYLPPHQWPLGPYSEYVSQNNPFAASRAQCFADAHQYQSAHVQQYWNEAHARSQHHHTGFPDPYTYSTYGRYNGSYEHYGKSPGYVRGHQAAGYQDYSRTPFEDTRTLYGRAHEGLSGGASSVNGCFMEIAPTGHQDDFYSSSLLASSQIPSIAGKAFMPTYR